STGCTGPRTRRTPASGGLALTTCCTPTRNASSPASTRGSTASRAARRPARPRRELPDAVVSANDQMAIGVVKALSRAGVRVPQDVAVVGFDDIFPGSLCDPPLTTVHQPMRMLGERSCARLLERIANPGLRPATELLPTELVLRSSCGCPPGAVVREPVPTLKVPRSELTAAAP